MDIVGWIAVIFVSIVFFMIVSTRYFVWSIRKNAIRKYNLNPLEETVLRIAEKEYQTMHVGERLPPNQTEVISQMLKVMPQHLKASVASGQMSFLDASELFLDQVS